MVNSCYRTMAVLVSKPVAHLADRSTKKPFVLTTFVFFTLFPIVLLHSNTLEWLIAAFRRSASPPARPCSWMLPRTAARCTFQSIDALGLYYNQQ